MSKSDYHKEFQKELSILHHLEKGNTTIKIINAIGKQKLHFIIRTYRLMMKLSPGLSDEDIQKNLLQIGIECRRLLGRSTEPDRIHNKWAELSKKCGHQYSARELFDNIIINEAFDMIDNYAHEELQNIYLRTKSITSNRPIDYASHYLIFALNYFLEKSYPKINISSIIASFIKEQKITEAGGKAEAKNIKEKYLNKHKAAFVNNIKHNYQRSLHSLSVQRAIKKNDKGQYVFDEKAQYVSRLVADDLLTENSPFIFYFPEWDEVFS